MKKRLLACLLCVLMLVSLVPVSAFAAEEVVAKIGDNSYTNFAAAMQAANAMTGDVTVEIHGEVEFTNSMELNQGSYTSITFVGKSNVAKITINQSAGGDYLEANKTVAFKDLILAKANPAWSGNSGHMGNYFSIQGGTVTYTDCTFANGACTSGGTATYTNCVFNNTSEYGLWVYDDALVTVNGGTIDSTKGIKVYSEDETTVTSTLTVQNATFTGNVTSKPAVAIGYAESVTLIGNTYNNSTGVLELDSGSDADCEGITFVAKDASGKDIASTLTAVDRSNNDAACGVLMNGKIYTTVSTATEDAQPGDTITVLTDVTVDSVLNFTGKNLTIDLNDKTMTFTAGQHVFDNTTESVVNVTFKNGNMVIAVETSAGDAIFRVGNSYSAGHGGNTLTLDDVNLTGDGYSSSFGVFYVYDCTNGVQNKLVVKNSTINLKNETFTAGAVFRANSLDYTVAGVFEIENTNMELIDTVRGFHAGTVTIKDCDSIVIKGADLSDDPAYNLIDTGSVPSYTYKYLENGINSSKLTVINSNITIANAADRGLTLDGADVVLNNSSVVLKDSLVDIRFKRDSADANMVVLDDTSYITFESARVGSLYTTNPNQLADAEKKLNTLIDPIPKKVDGAYHSPNVAPSFTLVVNASESALDGAGEVSLNIGGNGLSIDHAANVVVTCTSNPELVLTKAVGENGYPYWTVELPNEDASYTFTATYTDPTGAYSSISATCTVTVGYVAPAKQPTFDYVLFALAARYSQKFDVIVTADNATVTGDTTVKYKRNTTLDITPADGYKLVDVIANGQSLGAVDSVTFKRVVAPQTLVVVTEALYTNPYADIADDNAAVQYVTENGIMTAAEEGKFAPETEATRALIADVLYALAGKPEFEATVTVNDSTDAAILWAASNGILTPDADGLVKAATVITMADLNAAINAYAGTTDTAYSTADDMTAVATRADVANTIYLFCTIHAEG